MYSPKIAEELIPVLYHAAKQRCVPMTKLVNQLISAALSHEDLSQLPAKVVAEATRVSDDACHSAA